MKQTKKLGRGLEDFSHLFLSSPGEGRDPSAVPPGNGQHQAAAGEGTAKTVCIVGERGAGEKTYLAVKVALALAEQGKKVVVFDADFSLPRLCMLMGKVPSNSMLTLIAHPEQHGARFSENGGVTLLTLVVDVASLARLPERERLPLAAAIRGSLEEAAVVLVAASGRLHEPDRGLS